MAKMAKKTIYFDHNATTPVDPLVIEAMAAAAVEYPGNPASQHQLGRAARRRLDEIREQIGTLLGAHVLDRVADEIVFTSGATEANNLAIRGLAGPTPVRVLVSSVEHPSVLQVADQLAVQGYDVVKIPVDTDGVVDLGALARLLEKPTRLVSVMFGNHETGGCQPVDKIGELCQAAGALFHTDAVQSVAKVPLDFQSLGATAMTLSAHKFHGPRGVGALIMRHGTPLVPQLFGGPQQHGLRPGTESVALPAGMLKALEVAREDTSAAERIRSLRDDLEREILSGAPEAVVLGANAERLPHASCMAFEPLDRQAMFLALDMAGVACSTGSACESGSSEPSPVLREMGCREGVIQSALRFSLGRHTTPAEVSEGARRILAVFNDLRDRIKGLKRPVPATRDGHKPL